jgi:hypothetical protein
MLHRRCADTKEDKTVLVVQKSQWCRQHVDEGESSRRLPALGRLRLVRISLLVTKRQKFEEVSVNGWRKRVRLPWVRRGVKTGKTVVSEWSGGEG